MCTAVHDTHDLRPAIAAAVAVMPAREAAFWTEVDASGTTRAQARRMLDTAVSWIVAGKGHTADPYALVLTWLAH